MVDNVKDMVSSTPSIVTGELSHLLQHQISPTDGAAYCCAAHGLSLLITAYGPNGPKSMLFDGGPAAYAIEMNGSRLGIDFSKVGAAVLSQSHWDHSGGLPRALEMIRSANGGKPIPFLLHPAMFQERGFRMPDASVSAAPPFPGPRQWRDFGADPVVTTEPETVLDDLFFISGEIPHVTAYEKGLEMNMHRASADAAWERESIIADERFVAVNVRDNGLVVFSGCSHAGIVNVLHHAQASFPGVKLYSVVGGFHLAGPNEAIIPETARHLGRLGLSHIIAGHCTGWRAINASQIALGDKVVVPLAVGKLFSL